MALNGVIKRIAGPAYMGSSATNIYTPASSDVYTVITSIHFCNVTTSSATFSLYIGATGGSTGGTELFKTFTVAPLSTYDWPCLLKLVSTDFLSGLASAGSTITITVQGFYVAS